LICSGKVGVAHSPYERGHFSIYRGMYGTADGPLPFDKVFCIDAVMLLAIAKKLLSLHFTSLPKKQKQRHTNRPLKR
jgi:hypothetical protein